MAFIPRDYNDPLCVYSLRLLVSGYGGPIARVVRESDLIEGDVYPDSNNQISYDSTIIVNPNETSALTLGEFLNISGYGNPDGLADVYEARINKLYDQSAAVNHVVAPNFATSLAFVEHTLPAIFPNSTNIHTVNGIPSFLPLSTIPSLTINNVRGREMSFHFVSENTSATTYFGFINLVPYYTVSGAWNESNSSVTTGVTPFSSEAWLMSDNYYNGVLGDVAGEFTRTRIGIPTDDSLVCTIQAQLLDTSYTQSDFPDNSLTLSIFSNQWYADIIAYDGYDNIRRLTIEDLLSSGNVNVETKAFTSTLAFTDDGTVDNSFIAQFGTPAAAYSVRSLRGLTGVNGPKILRVRREVDNAEVDVYTDPTGWVSLDSPVVIVPAITGQIDGGTGVEIDSLASTLGEFVADADHEDVDSLGSPTTAKVVVWYDQSSADYTIISEEIDARGAPVRIRVVGGTYDAYEFDLYFDDNDSISLSSYVADTYEISDGATQVTANLTLGTLQALVDDGMTDATVCVWYDQSGNANDATQTTTGDQPQIVSSGTVLNIDGKPAVQFNGSSHHMDMYHADLYGQSRLDSFIHYQSSDSLYLLYSDEASGGGRYSFVVYDGNTSTTLTGQYGSPDLYVNGTQVPIIYGTTTRGDLHTAIVTNGVSAIAGAIETQLNSSTTIWNAFGISAYNGIRLNGKISEMIFYNTTQDDNRTGIEGNINAYYDIYGTGNTGVNTPLLDTYSDAAAAYSLRKLRTSYNGPVNLSKRKDAIQNVSTAQPKIYDSSTGVVVIGGNPAVLFDGVDDEFIVSHNDLINQNRLDYFAHYQTSDNAFIMFTDYPSRYSWAVRDASTDTFITTISPAPDLYINGSQVVIDIGVTTRDDLHTEMVTNGALAASGALESTIGANTTSWETFGISAYLSLRRFSGKFTEIIFYNTPQDGNRIDIENNINSAFQIYAANFSSVLDTVPLAKAAYSIRRLTKNYIDPIITVTNGSTTKDFYADFWGNLDVDALTSFANGGTLSVTKWWDQSGEGVHLLTTADKPTLAISNNEVSVNTTNKFYEPLLDRYEGAAAAYSLRVLKGDYTGPLVRVRRDGTNTEVDVYPDENLTISLNSPVLNVAEATTDVTANPQYTLATTLGEFVADAGSDPDGLGATVSAFVVVWYDQANSNNASQDISTAQPKIYDSVDGVVTENGKPQIDFDGTNHFLSNNALTTSQPTTVSLVGTYDTGNDYFLDGSTSSNRQAVFVNSGEFSAYAGTTISSGVSATANMRVHIYTLFNSTSSEIYVNSVGVSSQDVGTGVLNGVDIGQRYTNSFRLDGQIQEIVFWNSNQTSAGNRTGIEDNINTYYSIYAGSVPEQQTVAVYNNAINTTVDLNATYTDLKEIIKYE